MPMLSAPRAGKGKGRAGVEDEKEEGQVEEENGELLQVAEVGGEPLQAVEADGVQRTTIKAGGTQMKRTTMMMRARMMRTTKRTRKT